MTELKDTRSRIENIAKKDSEKLEKFDSRAVQTMFRTLMRNHYNLLRMVDNKASIILTMNSIIISLMMGVIYMAGDSDRDVLQFGSKILLNFGMCSMVFALIAMLPHRYFKVKDSNYKGSLYAGNFSKLTFAEYKKEMERIMLNGHNTYIEMINDLYALGKSITIKQTFIWISVLLFMAGLVGAIVHALYHGVMIERVFFE